MDKLTLLRGSSLRLNDKLEVRHPTLSEIGKYGEQGYWQIIKHLTATPTDYKVALWDMGVDWETVGEFQLFISLCKDLTPTETGIVLGDLDLSSLQLGAYNDNPEPTDLYLADSDGKIVLDSISYELMTSFLREISNFEKNLKKPGNAVTKKIYIELDRQEIERAKKKQFKSLLAPLISAMVNTPGFKYDYNTVWDLPIYAFFDAVKRVQKIKHCDNILTGIYTGNVDGSKVKSELNWLGEL